MKHRIMEAILSNDNNLTKEEIDWAICNIPNEIDNTKSDFNHEATNVGDACGITEKIHKEIKKEYFAIKQRCGEKGSHMIEELEKTGSKLLLRSLITRSVMDIEEIFMKKTIEDLRELFNKLK